MRLHSSKLYFIFNGMELVIENKIDKLNLNKRILQTTKTLWAFSGYDYAKKVQIHQPRIVGFP